MVFTCKTCFRVIPFSIDPGKMMKNFEVHCREERHTYHCAEDASITAWNVHCKVCNEHIRIKGFDLRPLSKHVFDFVHCANAEEEYLFRPAEFPGRIPPSLHTVDNQEQEPFVDRFMHFTCKICYGNVPLAYDYNTTMRNVREHLNEVHHIVNCKAVPCGLLWNVTCDLCVVRIWMREFDSSPLGRHVAGYTHRKNLEEFRLRPFEESLSEDSSVCSDYDGDPEQERFEHNGLYFNCRLCYNIVPLTFDVATTMHNVKEHFNESDHIRHYQSVPGGMVWDLCCKLCNVKIWIRGFDSRRVARHVSGGTHCRNTERFLGKSSLVRSERFGAFANYNEYKKQKEFNVTVMYFTCQICDRNIPLSCDAEATMQNVKTHFDGSRHVRKCHKVPPDLEWGVFCNLCDHEIWLSGFDSRPVANHAYDFTHCSNAEEYAGPSVSCMDFGRRDSSRTGDHGELREPCFWCNVCRYKITLSNADDKATYLQMVEHVKGRNHTVNLKVVGITGYRNFVDCRFCNCKVPLSLNLDTTKRNLAKHISGQKHRVHASRLSSV